MAGTIPADILHRETPVSAVSIRDADGHLSKKFSSFDVSSGVLLWGQLLPMFHGTLQADFTNSAARVPEHLPGGTIVQRVYTYKSAARNGAWSARRYSGSPLEVDHNRPYKLPKSHVGWVICHEDIDPMEVIGAVKAISPNAKYMEFSIGNTHINKDVLYINRYDWSHHWRGSKAVGFRSKFQAYAEPAIGQPWDNPYAGRESNINVLEGGYFIALDAESWDLDFLRAYKVDCEADRNEAVEKVFRKTAHSGKEEGQEGEGGKNFGAYVRKPDTEYEFGWLVFSGNKHADHDADELIGIVYDGNYGRFDEPYHVVEADP